MAVTFELNAKTRTQTGKGASRRLRRLGNLVPGIIYGGDSSPVNIEIDHLHLLRSLENEAFYTHILTVKIDGKAEKAILKDLQRHPSLPRVTHIDLLRITGKEKITMRIPLHFIGEEDAPGVKESGGVISHYHSDIEIRCLPSDLPEYIQVDISKLALDETIHLSQLKIPKGIEIIELTYKNDLPVVSIHLPRVEVEEPEAAGEVAASEVPTAEKGKEKEPPSQ